MARGAAKDSISKGSKGNRAGGAGMKEGERVVLDRGVMKKSKDCLHCTKPFTWRKKWERSWDTVIYCSDKCKKEAAKKRIQAS